MSQTFPAYPLRAVAALKGIPDATVARLPMYLRALKQLSESRIDTVSSRALAEAVGVNSAQLRELVNCPMTRDAYIAHLKSVGAIDPPAD